MDKSGALLFLRNFALWVLAFASFPLWIDSMAYAWEHTPWFYVTKSLFLFFVCYISFILIQSKHYIYYALFLVSIYLLVYYSVKLTGYPSAESIFIFFCPEWKESQQASLFTFRFIYNFVIFTIPLFHLRFLRIEQKEALSEKLKSELIMLKSQIGPHFLFNSLNSIYSLALIKSDKTPDAIIALSKMMRYTIEGAQKEWVPIQETKLYLDRYVELEKLRLPRKTELEYITEVQGKNTFPPLLLIVFYENAFKYGVSSQKEAKILIHLTVKDDILHLYTCNSIIPSNKFRSSTQQGLANAKRRLELIFPKRHKLLIVESKELFQVKLSIELHPHHE